MCEVKWRSSVRYPNDSHYSDLYRNLRNRCVALTRKGIRTKVTQTIYSGANSGSQSKKFKCLKSLTNSSSSSSLPFISADKTLIYDSKGIADSLNSSFTTIAQKYRRLFDNSSFNRGKISKFVNDRLPPHVGFSIPEPSRHEILCYLRDLKTNASTGLDDISATTIRTSMHALVEPLHHILCNSFKQSQFPDGWKHARVTPIPKDKFTTNPVWENLRPISVLKIMSKISEKHVSKHVTHFFESNNLFHHLQSGSRKRHSCETALLHLVDICYKNLSEKNKSSLIFTDFSKAFDLINHEILLEKLKLYRFDIKTINWFRSYLYNRKQTVKVNGVFSDLADVNTGVPQGSILGPLLFLVYTNCMPLSILRGITNSCVDDATIMHKLFTTEPPAWYECSMPKHL